MAKTITIANIDNNKLNTNSPVAKLLLNNPTSIKTISINTIQFSDKFSTLFTIDEDVLNAIATDMKNNGYDISQPIIIWKEKGVLLDGHTRIKAARIANITNVPVVYASFNTDNDVIDYMYRLQFHRRNITDKELIDLIINALDQFETKYGYGSKAEYLANRFYGLSEAKAKQMIVVIDRANTSDIDKIRKGEISTYQIYLKYKTKNADTNDKKSKKDFYQYENRSVRFDQNGIFYFRDFNEKKDIKIFTLTKLMNHEHIRLKLQTFLENEILNNKDNEIDN